MTRNQLQAVHDALTELAGDWNQSAEDEDRGPANDWLCLTLADDGSGFLGRRKTYRGPVGETVNDIDDYHQFDDLDGLVKVLVDQCGVEFERA